jgi:hypothetical protein
MDEKISEAIKQIGWLVLGHGNDIQKEAWEETVCPLIINVDEWKRVYLSVEQEHKEREVLRAETRKIHWQKLARLDQLTKLEVEMKRTLKKLAKIDAGIRI